MIYADNAATTKMSPVALAAMLPALEDNYGNPSSREANSLARIVFMVVDFLPELF